jgi:hypothetical protein
MLNWEQDVLPVLEAAYEAWCAEAETTAAMGRSEPWVTTENVNAALSRQPDDPKTEMVLKHLESAGYITADRDIRNVSLEITFTEKGLRFVAGWPGSPEEATVARLLAALEEQVEAAETPEEKTALQRALVSLRAVPTGVLVNVLTRAVTGGIDAVT